MLLISVMRALFTNLSKKMLYQRNVVTLLLKLNSEWVLAWVELTCWERSVDILYAEHLESLEEYLASLLECVSTMVWETLAN